MRKVLKKYLIGLVIIMLLIGSKGVITFADSKNSTELDIAYRIENESNDLIVNERYYRINNLNSPNIVRRVPKINGIKINIDKIIVRCVKKEKDWEQEDFNLYNWNGEDFRYDVVEKEDCYEINMLFKNYKSVDEMVLGYRVKMPFVLANDVAVIETVPYDNNLNDIKVSKLKVRDENYSDVMRPTNYFVKGEAVAKQECSKYSMSVEFSLKETSKIEMATLYDLNSKSLKNYPMKVDGYKINDIKNKYGEELKIAPATEYKDSYFNFDSYDYRDFKIIAKIIVFMIVVIIAAVKSIKKKKRKNGAIPYKDNNNPNYNMNVKVEEKKDNPNKSQGHKRSEVKYNEKKHTEEKSKDSTQKQENDIKINTIPSKLPPAYLAYALQNGGEAIFLSTIFDFIRREIISVVEVNEYGISSYKFKINEVSYELLEYETELVNRLKDIEGLSTFNLSDIGNFFKASYFDGPLSTCESNFKEYIRSLNIDESIENLYDNEPIALNKWKVYKEDLINASIEDIRSMPITTLEKAHVYSMALGIEPKGLSHKITNEVAALSQYLDLMINKKEEKTNMPIEIYIYNMIKPLHSL